MLKYALSNLALALAFFVLPLFFPWWSVAIPAVLFGYFAKSNLHAFSAPSSILTLVWAILAQMQNSSNGGLLASKMGALFGGVSAFQLVLITAALGGLIGGLCGLTGYAFKQLLSK